MLEQTFLKTGALLDDLIRVLILDDHPAIVDGYKARLTQASDILVLDGLSFADQLEPALQKNPVDVLLLDVQVPSSPTNVKPLSHFSSHPSPVRSLSQHGRAGDFDVQPEVAD